MYGRTFVWGGGARHAASVEALESRRLLSRTIHVDINNPAAGPASDGTSWATAYADLQQALAVAAPGDEIRVADGIYKPTATTDQTISFQLKNGVTLAGGYAGLGAADPNLRDVAAFPTALSGNIGDPAVYYDNTDHVVVGSNTDATAVLDGFIVEAGHTAGSTLDLVRGAGMYNVHGSPTVRNCTFRENRAHDFGSLPRAAGGAMYNLEGAPALIDCTFVNNFSAETGGAIMNGGESGGIIPAPSIIRCTFSGNTAGRYGGAIANWWEISPTIEDCTFTNNVAPDGGAMYNIHRANPVILRTTFDGNSTGNSSGFGGTLHNYNASPRLVDCTIMRSTGSWGGAVYNDSASVLTMERCTLAGNGGGIGAAIYDNGSTLNLINCALVGNYTGFTASVIYGQFTAMTMANCTVTANVNSYAGGEANAIRLYQPRFPTTISNSIVWGNVGTPGPVIAGAGVTVRFSNVQGGYTGTGNLNADPLFVRNPTPGGDGAWGTADDDYGDLRLQIQSPCVDSGGNAFVPVGVDTDIAGLPRLVDFPGVRDPGAVVDMGAHELGLTLGLLHVPAGQTLALPAGRHTFVVEQLRVDAGGTLDVRDNSLAIEYSGAAPDVEALVRAGFDGGDWLGTGIVSSSARADGNFHVAVADNALLAAPFGTAQGGALFAGVNVDLTTVLIKFTHRADLNLDGLITPDDSAAFGGNYDENGFATWATGDMNYDGIFTPDDGAIFGGAYDESLPAI